MLLLAHAKTNLVLSVQPGADASGYHDVRTVMCAFELADEVSVEALGPGKGFSFSCDPDPLPAGADPRANLAWRAAEDMARMFGMPLDVRVRVRKAVPSQAGLGGGSSDAAAVVKGLAALWGVPADDARLVLVARGLGADVAFFLNEVPSYLDGRGDVLRETFEPFSAPAVLVKPASGVSTGACYRLLDEMAPEPPACAPALEALRARDIERLMGALGNNMQLPARRLAPELDEVLTFLEQSPGLAAAPLLCGSGSCVAAFTRDDVWAGRLADLASRRGWWARATRTLA